MHASVLSGNRNFEAGSIRTSGEFLMSPPLVVAYALAELYLKSLSASIGKERKTMMFF